MKNEMINYKGPSMKPTLRVGDGLQVIPYEDEQIRVGDVVVFRSAEQERYIVHRVVSVDAQGVRTRGDNNTNVDPWVLRPDDIIGRVVSARRKGSIIRVHGGRLGSMLARSLWTAKRIKAALVGILRPVYRWLMRRNVFRNLLSQAIETQIIYFRRPDGVEMQLLMGRRVIGRRPPGASQWRIRRPFRLFVNEASLPTEELNHKADSQSMNSV